MSELKTKIGLEIHVQLKTKSKMFCRCDNNAEDKEPNTTVCPVCLGMPGALPVTNKQAVLWTIKTGLALNCKINKIAKFDRKHYFYPDLPKGYQISQYDEPFCSGGEVEIDGNKIRLNRIHLEEDAGKLIHKNGKSLVDLNRAGTPLMEIVTEPDITSPKQAGDFLRKLQKIVRDVSQVSEASMEKGNLRCDANISVSDKTGKMSPIIELKNINSFRFVEKALTIEDARLKDEYPNWPEGNHKVTRGYDSKKNETYVQRTKEEAADYRYFPDPDLPPFDTSKLDLETLKAELAEDEETKIQNLIEMKITENDAKVLAKDKVKLNIFKSISEYLDDDLKQLAARSIINNYFGFAFDEKDFGKAEDYAKAVSEIKKGMSKQIFSSLVKLIHEKGLNFEESFSQFSADDEKINLEQIIEKVIAENPKEAKAFKEGKKQLIGFFMGQIMKETHGKVDPTSANKLLLQQLNK